MRIMTFNTQHCMNYITKEIDYDKMAKTINDLAPDFVVLQEIRGAGTKEGFEDQTKKLAELCGMEYYYFAKAIDVYDEPSPYGNAIISKRRILDVKTIPIPDSDPAERKGTRWYETRCILKAKLEGGLTVLGMHAGLNPDEHDNAIKTVLENAESTACVLLGDFNMRPDNEKLKRFSVIFNDTAEATPELLFTHPSDNPDKKIDYIFVTKDIRVISVNVPAVVASDHRPIIADIAFNI